MLKIERIVTGGDGIARFEDGRVVAVGPAGAVATLARLPSTTPVLVTWRTGSSTRVGVQSVEVPPLAPEAGLRLLRRELIAQGLPDVPLSDDTEWLPIVAAAAGHPLAVCAAARQLRTSTVRQVADALYDARGFAGRLYREVWEAVFAGASETVRAVVQAVVAVRTSGSLVDTSAVSAATGIVPAALHDALVGAVDAGLLVPLGGPNRRHFAPALFVDRFLAATMLHMPDRAAAVWDADDGHSTHVA